MAPDVLWLRRPVHSGNLRLTGVLLQPNRLGVDDSPTPLVHALLDLGLSNVGGNARSMLVANDQVLRTLAGLPAPEEGLTLLVRRASLEALPAAALRQTLRWPIAQILGPEELPLHQPTPALCVYESAQVERDRLTELKRQRFEPLVLGIDTRSAFDAARRLGFVHFEGTFWKEAEPVGSRALAPNQAALMEVMGVVNDPASSMNDIERIVSRDPALSARLVRALSVSVTGGREVRSLRQALVFLGMRAVAQWTTLMLVCSIEGRPEGLLHSARMRAIACEDLAAERRLDPHGAFLVGLLSRVDGMMGLPMTDFLRSLPLALPLKRALLGREGPLGHLLAEVEAVEAGDTSRLQPGVVEAWNRAGELPPLE